MYYNIKFVWGIYMNDFEIVDKYGYKDYDYLFDLLNFALKKLKIDNATFSIILTNDEEIHKLNKEYRGIDRTTDVISFALNDNGAFPGPINVLGDIYISIPKMKEQAIEYAHSEKRELSFLALHGLLHLLGYDHTKGPKEEEEMFGLQREILDEKGIKS
jgi:probable rRNA maturation factor